MKKWMALAANVVMLLAVLAFGRVLYLSSDLDGRMAFRQLDEAGVINPGALAQVGTSYQFDDGYNLAYRNTVPRYLMTSVQRALIAMTVASAAICVCNILMHASRSHAKKDRPSRQSDTTPLDAPPPKD